MFSKKKLIFFCCHNFCFLISLLFTTVARSQADPHIGMHPVVLKGVAGMVNFQQLFKILNIWHICSGMNYIYMVIHQS